MPPVTMGVIGLIQLKVVVSVIFLHVLEAYAYHGQQGDSNDSDILVQTNTISDYTDIQGESYPRPGPDQPSDQGSLDTWSVIWYIASFGGLILFFLIVSCSEWCCRRNARRNCQRNNVPQVVPQVVPDTPPPSYDLFAPPKYDDLLWGGSSRRREGEKSEYDIYVVPVHALDTIMEDARREEAPPSYQSASTGFAPVSDLPQVHTSNAPSRNT